MTVISLDRAACAGQPDAIFFPPSGVDTTAARRICAGCPIRLDCLRFAIEVEATSHADRRYGVYGGLTPTQRARLARKATR